MSSPFTPSRRDVELTIAALEIDDEQEKESLRRFYERERFEAIDVRWGDVLWFCLKVTVGVLVVWALILEAFSWHSPLSR